MENNIKAVRREVKFCGNSPHTTTYGINNAEKVISYHRSFPEYMPTPLAKLNNLAEFLGVGSVHVKDESHRFGLNAFKVLGGSYCLGVYIAERMSMDKNSLSYAKISDDSVKQKLGELTFVTATDGNHGRGIAWAANRIGHNSVVFMPKGSAKQRLESIQNLGSNASVTELNYDNTVRYAKKIADQNGWVLVQDTSWEGYETAPTWIMQGYTTMAYEIVEQLGAEKPTHIFLQSGVGSMAGAIAGFFADLYKENMPRLIIVEPNEADCMYQTAKYDDGNLHSVKGSLNTIMAGLACGEPCGIGWDVLKEHASCFISMPDYVAAKGMRVLGNPIGDDARIISGESGASTLGLVVELMQKDDLEYLRKSLGLDKDSKILCISTEGDTDRQNYRRIVWDNQF